MTNYKGADVVNPLPVFKHNGTMKRLITILLLTLFTGVALSQKVVIYPDTGIWTYYKMAAIHPTVVFYDPVVTLNTLEEYSQDCYDDSTAVTYKIFDPWDTVFAGFSGEVDGYGNIRVREDLYEPFYHYGEHIKDTIIYEHTQPTFIGFIQWLKDK